MGIETILIVAAVILVVSLWGGARKRRAGRDRHDASPPRLSQR